MFRECDLIHFIFFFKPISIRISRYEPVLNNMLITLLDSVLSVRQFLHLYEVQNSFAFHTSYCFRSVLHYCLYCI